jgi:prefoldin subunit 5
MIVPPTTLGAGRSVLDVIAQTARPAVAVAVAPTAPLPILTDHALLVLLGKFAQHLGLVRLLEAVPIPQKTRDHRPQTKLIQFLIGILAGLDYLQDFNAGACPLGADTAVLASWGQDAFAHYSGVSRTLAAADATTLQAVVAALQQVSHPFLERDVLHLLRRGQPLVVDIDLTGRPVSPTSTDYVDAAFGWMDAAVAKGYQAAISSLSGGPQGRVLLNSQRYAGRAKSAECLRAAVVAVEQTLGLRPRRRTALVQAQLTTLHAQVQDTAQRLATVRDQLQELTWQHDMSFQGVTAPSARAVQQQTRRVQQIARTRQQLSTLAQHRDQLQAQQAVLQTWLAQLEADNAGGSSRAPIVIRLDAGFATDANLAHLIELGYTVVTKVHSGHTTSRLQRGLDGATVWERVGANAEAVALGAQRIGDGRYALQALQVRYQVPEGLRHTTLLYYDDAPPPAPAAWFAHYNGRQVIEAGIKENKGVFTMRRPLVRSEYGMQIQEQFALFAANLVRWAAEWAREQIADAPPALARALTAVKTLVRVVAHSRAWLVETEMGCGLVFDTHSPFAGAVLRISGQVVFQNVMPFFASDRTTVQQVT